MHGRDERTKPIAIGATASAAGDPAAGGAAGGGGPGGGAALLRAGVALREGRYVLDRPLGRGGMAAVWLARDRRLRRPVAIKVLSDTLAGDPAYLSRFEREARIAAGLAHPNLIRIYDYGTETGRPFLVMEYVAGGDLAGRLAGGQALDPERLARELLDALRYIHGAGILHRDVKTQNVLIDRDGRARLTDFGIARPADATSLTQTGIVLGTGRYIAPEVFAGEPPSERSDLYSLGVVLGGVIAEHGSHPQLGRLVGALRAKDPDRRPASAGAALRVLDRPTPTDPEPRGVAAAAPAPTAAHAAVRKRPPASWVTRGLAAAGVAATIIAVVAVATIAGGGDDDPGGGVAAGDRAAEAGEEAGQGREERAAGERRANGGGEPEREREPEAQADGHALNERGFELINAGRPGEAIPLLERAVDALEGSGDITYAYALYNLGHALRLAGRPADAVPVLEARYEIPNQREVVRSELAAARAEAGLTSEERSGRGRGRGRGGDDDDDD